jgi:histidinol dehydrogenase
MTDDRRPLGQVGNTTVSGRRSSGQQWVVMVRRSSVGGRFWRELKVIEIIQSQEKERLAIRLQAVRDRNVALDDALVSEVTAIIREVRTRGDAALIDYAERFDGVQLQSSELRVPEETLQRSAQRVDSLVLESLREAIQNVRAFHEQQKEESWNITPVEGVWLGQRINPIARAGLYVPGGTAAYPSSVVMNVVPAQVAGVRRIVVTSPPRRLAENPAVAAALIELKVTEVYAVGGAQAIAALAYGTETVPRVDKITGPGNKYVAVAKKLVFGTVGIDSIAGPSEVVIIADGSARADFVAADLLAQAEHASDASAVLLTISEELARDTAAEMKLQAASLSRRAILEQSLARYGAIVLVGSLDEACAITNELAPEHLELMTDDNEGIAAQIREAGAIFFGAHTPEAVGDYLAGPNHVLPTGGAARFSSALGVYDFVKRTSLLRYSSDAIKRSAGKIAALAAAEGLDAHARSALIRLEQQEA